MKPMLARRRSPTGRGRVLSTIAAPLLLAVVFMALGCGENGDSNGSVIPPETEAGTGTVVISGRLVQ